MQIPKNQYDVRQCFEELGQKTTYKVVVMLLSFPAMQGQMGNRDYFVAMVKLSLVPKMFRFKDWVELPPEQRAQRVLQKRRVPEIAHYILDNEDGYLFSSITASYDCDPKFKPFKGQTNIGTLEVPFDADFVINDGQHRRAAIEEALKENPKLGNETISVVLFPFEDLSRMQQMFSDLNRTARKTSKSLDILYNHRDLMAQVVLTVSEKIDCFKTLVDKDRISLPLRSPRLFTLGSLYDSTTALLGSVVEEDFDEKLDFALRYWTTVADNMPNWQKVRDNDLKPFELRQAFISTHAVVIWAIGAMGQTLQINNKLDWEEKLKQLREIDWRRTNKEWQGIAMSGTDVVNRRQSRKDTASFLKTKLGLPLTESEERSLRGAQDPTLVLDELGALIDAGNQKNEVQGETDEPTKPR